MKKIILIISTILLASISMLNAQTKIEVELENYPNDTLIMAYYYADRILVQDTIYSEDQKHFTYAVDSMLPEGVYLLVTVPENKFYQLIMTEDDQKFRIKIDYAEEGAVTIKGSKENELFYDYLDYLSAKREIVTKIQEQQKQLDSTNTKAIETLDKRLEEVNTEVESHQRDIIKKHPESITAMIIKANLPLDEPTYEGTEEEQKEARYEYYKAHYFDNLDLGRPALLRTNLMHDRIEYYVNNLTYQIPDSIINSVDYILEELSPNPDAFQFYLSHFLNSYANSKFIGMDAVHVHLALEYYDKGKAPWVTEENLKEIVKNARMTKPTLIGQPAPDFTVYTQDKKAISLADIETDFTVLVFWKPDCGHCAKAMPHIIEFAETYADSSITLLTVCTKTGKKYDSCWEGVKEKKMESLVNTGDQYNRSGILTNYYVRSTPLIYIIDKDKKIALKKVPADNLSTIMPQLMADYRARATMDEK